MAPDAPRGCPAPQVSGLGSVCLLHALNCIDEPAPYAGAAHGIVAFQERLSEHGVLASLHQRDFAPAGAQSVVLGHQQLPDQPRSCPACAEDAVTGVKERTALRLAAVAVAMDSSGRVLLTQRPRSMRTFPGAWVLPGGSVDANDASVAAAAQRELFEETGLRAIAISKAPVCLWESCFPTTFAEWGAAAAEGRRRSHHLIAFVLAQVDSAAELSLQASECERACWVPIEELCTLNQRGDGVPMATVAVDSQQSYERAERWDAAKGSTDLSPVPSISVRGIYPNQVGEGLGRGHLWALHLVHRISGLAGSQLTGCD